MSISSTLSSALTGLTASARAAELVSSNVANAMTEGYVRRELELSARELGGVGQGVRVTGVRRDVDQVLMSDRRIAQAGVGDRDVHAAFYDTLETSLGLPEDAASLHGRIAALDAALIEAASRPESDARLATVLDASQKLVSQLNTVSDQIQSARTVADTTIGAQVEQLNQSLSRVRDLNIQIRADGAAGRDSSALMDLRQQEVDKIAGIVPLREVDRGNGVIALYSTGGAALVDGKASTFGFTGVGLITPDMTLASGALSGLTLNDRPIDHGDAGMIAGGSLSANFAVRDALAPAAQEKLDAVARDLIDRFADPALDPTLLPGAAGLFTDQGAAFLPADEVGIAQRISINAVADPSQGGALWRLRDGLGASAAGSAGNSALLTALHEALVAPRVPASGGFTSASRSFSALSGDLISHVSSQRLATAAESAFAATRANALQTKEQENGVDTDQEMQKLLLIEQAYAANARVVQAADEMIKTLMGI